MNSEENFAKKKNDKNSLDISCSNGWILFLLMLWIKI